MDAFAAYLETMIPERDNLKIVKQEAEKYCRTHSADECLASGLALYQSDNFQIQEVGVFLLSQAAHVYGEALDFMRDTVSQHESWKVQEILAMAFDNHCRRIGYETALPLIKAWLNDDRANVRRAASEGLRVWTSRPYFREHPQAAIDLLAPHREDDSPYVRKSIGNALRDISKKHPELIGAEVCKWDLSSRKTMQVYKLASRFLPNEE